MVGKETPSFCTRCQRELDHVIVSMVEGFPAKVMCLSCKAIHKHRRQTRLVTGKKTVSRPKKIIISNSALWEQRLAEKNQQDVRPYEFSKSYAKGDLIQHPKFGLGVVEEVRLNGKVLILFRDQERILVHAHAV